MPNSVSREDFALTDYGNAERLVESHSGRFRYCGGKWLVYDRTRWSEDRTNEITEAAKATVRDFKQHARSKQEDAWAWRSENAARLSAMVRLASSDPALAIAPEQLDAQPHLLNLQNGTYNLDTKELQKHAPNDQLTKRAGVMYDPTAQCPRWNNFLNEVSEHDEALIGYVKRALGYSLLANTNEQCLFIAVGGGSNGKTTLLETVAGVLGDYAINSDSSTLLTKAYDRTPNDVARLHGARFVVASETREGRSLDEVLVKQLTGGDLVSARFLYREWFDFQPVCTIWMGVNHLPEIASRDHGIWRRIRVVPFDVKIPANKINKNLKAELIGESSGIFNWLLEGLAEYEAEGLSPPRRVREAIEAYRNDTGPISGFLKEGNVFRAVNAQCEKGALYRCYEDWVGYYAKDKLTKTSFGKAMKAEGLKEDSRKRHWIGITITPAQIHEGQPLTP